MRIHRQAPVAAVTACLVVSALIYGGQAERQGGPPGSEDRARQEGAAGTFLTEIPQYPGNVILGRPTDRSVTLSVLLREAAKVRIAYGPQGKGLCFTTGMIALSAGEPREIVLDGLDAGADWQYRVLHAETAEPLLPEGGNGRFRTCPAPESAFVFTVQADSHLDGNAF